MVKWLNSFLFCVLVTLFSVETPAQNNKIDSLINVLKTAQEDTNKVNNLNILSDKLLRLGEYDMAMKYAEQGKVLANKFISSTVEVVSQAGKKEMGSLLNIIGVIYLQQSNYSIALEQLFAGLKINEEIRYRKGIASVLGNIGRIYENLGDYPKALEYQFKDLKIAEEIADKKLIANAFGSIGNIYKKQGDYPKALEQYFKSLKLQEELRNMQGMAAVHGNIGSIYGKQGEYSKGLEQFFKALKIKEEIKDKQGIANSLGNIGVIYDSEGSSAYSKGNKNFALFDRYPKALEYYLKSLKIEEEIGNRDGIIASFINLGGIYTTLKKFKGARNYLNDALSLSKEIGYTEWIKESYQGLSVLDSTTSNYKESLENYKQYIIYKDSLLNEENTKKTVQTQMQYEFDKKEGETKAEQDKKDVIANEEKQKQKIIIASVSLGLFLVLILAIVIFRSLRQNQKKNKIITEQKEIVEKQKELVEEKQKEILDSIHYAKRIQTALITSEKYIEKNLNRLNDLTI